MQLTIIIWDVSQMKKKNDHVIDERKFENNYITFLLMDKKSSNLPIDGWKVMYGSSQWAKIHI
jgi:hypothetical protein